MLRPWAFRGSPIAWVRRILEPPPVHRVSMGEPTRGPSSLDGLSRVSKQACGVRRRFACWCRHGRHAGASQRMLLMLASGYGGATKLAPRAESAVDRAVTRLHGAIELTARRNRAVTARCDRTSELALHFRSGNRRVRGARCRHGHRGGAGDAGDAIFLTHCNGTFRDGEHVGCRARRFNVGRRRSHERSHGLAGCRNDERGIRRRRPDGHSDLARGRDGWRNPDAVGQHGTAVARRTLDAA